MGSKKRISTQESLTKKTDQGKYKEEHEDDEEDLFREKTDWIWSREAVIIMIMMIKEWELRTPPKEEMVERLFLTFIFSHRYCWFWRQQNTRLSLLMHPNHSHPFVLHLKFHFFKMPRGVEHIMMYREDMHVHTRIYTTSSWHTHHFQDILLCSFPPSFSTWTSFWPQDIPVYIQQFIQHALSIDTHSL